MTLYGFIDNRTSSQEAEEKWYSRREEQVSFSLAILMVRWEQDREMSLNLLTKFLENYLSNVALQFTIRKSAITMTHWPNTRRNSKVWRAVVYSFLTHLWGAILSADRDFYRYGECFMVYSRFSMEGGYLKLFPQSDPGFTASSSRKLNNALPKTTTQMIPFDG